MMISKKDFERELSKKKIEKEDKKNRWKNSVEALEDYREQLKNRKDPISLTGLCAILGNVDRKAVAQMMNTWAGQDFCDALIIEDEFWYLTRES